MRRAVAICSAASVALLAGCFSVNGEPSCSYKCGPKDACPMSYSCANDGYCHLADHTGACAFPADDLGVTSDLPDLGEID